MTWLRIPLAAAAVAAVVWLVVDITQTSPPKPVAADIPTPQESSPPQPPVDAPPAAPTPTDAPPPKPAATDATATVVGEATSATWTAQTRHDLGKLGRGAGVRAVEWTLTNPTDAVRHLRTVRPPNADFFVVRTVASPSGGVPRVRIDRMPLTTPLEIGPRERFTVRTAVDVAAMSGAELGTRSFPTRRRAILEVVEDPTQPIELIATCEPTSYLVYEPDPKLFLNADDARLPFGRRSETTIDWKVRRGDREPFRVVEITRQPRGFEVTTEPASPDLAEWWIRLRAVDVQRTGLVRDWIRFQTDTAQEGELFFAGTITPPITVTPADIVRFDNLVRGAPARAELRVEGPPGKDLRDVVADVKLPSGLTANARAEVHVDHAASLRIAVVFDVPADAPAGWVRGSLSLTFPGMRVTEERMLHGWLAEPPK